LSDRIANLMQAATRRSPELASTLHFSGDQAQNRTSGDGRSVTADVQSKRA
jgi:hypothetical protein